MKKSKRFLVVLSFLIMGVSDIYAQVVDLPPIRVIAPTGNINGWVTLCTGTQCNQIFGSISQYWVGNGNEAETAPGDENIIVRLATTDVTDNPNNNEDGASCSAVLPVRMNHAQSDIAYSRLTAMPRQRYSRGEILRVSFDNGESELYVYTGPYTPPIAVPRSCG